MKIYENINALSDFRARSTLQHLQSLDSAIQSVQAEYVHFVDTKKDLTAAEARELADLLTYDTPFSGKRTGELFLVVPRPGTISPWSTKATDIAHNSGLDGINRIERGVAYYVTSPGALDRSAVGAKLHDRMTEAVLDAKEQAAVLFEETAPAQLREVDILKGGREALVRANSDFGLALDQGEIDYLITGYNDLKRNPTDVELMMFAAVNSEHCRHKVFNADWVIDGKKQPKSLFKMIKNTYEKGGEDVLSAYSDNAAVLKGPQAGRFFADPADNTYRYHEEPNHLVIKVETHNHPTAIAPFPGAATGAGGEIRDEGATGRGAKPKMGLTGFSVSNLNLPGAVQPWEKPYGKPGRIVSALDVMIAGPLGGAAYNNEFGRPNLCGYFRTYEQALVINIDEVVWGYHKPLMIAGGLGNIRDMHVQKKSLPVGANIVVLGGPAMLIGLGGGAASSMHSGASTEGLDFASVQRANAEIERRAQEVINTCWALGEDNPILSIHDVGAGGLSNGLPELVHDSGLGAIFELRDIPNAEPGMSPLEIWCNEAQERYVLGVTDEGLKSFTELCERERCPFAVVGKTTVKEQLVLTDRKFKNKPVDLPMSVLFGKPPRMTRTVQRAKKVLPAFETEGIELSEAIERVLRLPAVGSKKFLITIGDRTVGGMTARDQMVGPWQVPVSDVAVTASSYDTSAGEAMGMGERTPVALIDGPASARLAIGETITNMAAAPIANLNDIKLSANWMAAVGYGNEDENLYDTVHAVGEEFCPALGLTVPVGKDSLSMRTVWQDDTSGYQKSVTSPLSLIISGFAPVTDVARTLTPQLQRVEGSVLLLIDLGQGNTRLGGSALAQVYGAVGNQAPDADPKLLKSFFKAIQQLNDKGLLLAYHDRSDGGLLATVCEMAFAGRMGVQLELEPKTPAIDQLFNEELGAVIQVAGNNKAAVLKLLQAAIGKESVWVIGKPTLGTGKQKITIAQGNKTLYSQPRSTLEQWWSSTSYHIQKLRDNPASAQSEKDLISDDKDPGISPVLTFAPAPRAYKTRPSIAVFREQGVNGQVEMAAAFDKAGFNAVDVHLNDLIRGKVKLDDFSGLVACGGFSYGDVLGAGEGWAKSILFNKQLREQFKKFFERDNTFSLGVCNGCQMLSNLKPLIPGAEDWPRFLKNTSEQFEARFVSVKVNQSPSIFFKGMEGSILPIPVAHGEGRAMFAQTAQQETANKNHLISLQYVDNYGRVTDTYPYNPNGSPDGITGLTTPDGRATIMMPHPERAFLTKQYSWHSADWSENGPWFQMFQNARDWLNF